MKYAKYLYLILMPKWCTPLFFFCLHRRRKVIWYPALECPWQIVRKEKIL